MKAINPLKLPFNEEEENDILRNQLNQKVRME